MNILYPSDKAQTEEINSLTYGQFRQRFPKLEGVKLPRPERLLNDAETLPSLVAVDRDYVFAVYPDGICLCQRENKSTVYAVSGCARIVYHSTTGVRYVIGEDETSDFPWFYPLLTPVSKIYAALRESKARDSKRLRRLEAFLPSSGRPAKEAKNTSRRMERPNAKRACWGLRPRRAQKSPDE